jgi:hypothetical protein
MSAPTPIPHEALRVQHGGGWIVMKKGEAVIDYSEIAPGDQVTIRDPDGNQAVVEVDGDAHARWVHVFGVQLTILRRHQRRGQQSRPGAMTPHEAEWRPMQGVRIVGHTPSMFPAPP